LDIKNQNIPNKRYLSIDWGKKNIGLAISDPFNEYAIPLRPIKNSDESIEIIIRIVKEKRINEIIIGYPLLPNNEISLICKLIEKFSSSLKERLQVEKILINISFYNEFYSTKKSKYNSEIYNNKKNWQIYKDSYSAQVILEDFLSEKQLKRNS